jgi:hypothetical protein
MWNKPDAHQCSSVTLLPLVSLQRTCWSTPTETRQFLRWPIKHSQEALCSLGIAKFPTTTQCNVFKQWVIFHRKDQYETLGCQLLPSSSNFPSKYLEKMNAGVTGTYLKQRNITHLRWTNIPIYEYYIENSSVCNDISYEHGTHSDAEWCL